MLDISKYEYFGYWSKYLVQPQQAHYFIIYPYNLIQNSYNMYVNQQDAQNTCD